MTTPSSLSYTFLAEKYSVTPEQLTKRIRVFLDVDGVVLPDVHSQEQADKLTSKEVTAFSLNGTDQTITKRIYWDADVVAALVQLSKNPLVDIVWLTSWRFNAPYVLDPTLGINSVGYLYWEQKMTDYAQVFKGVALKELYGESPAPFVWVDDMANIRSYDATHYFEPYEYEKPTGFVLDLYDEGDEDEEVIIPEEAYFTITPASSVGLTLTDVQKINDWVAQQTN